MIVREEQLRDRLRKKCSKAGSQAAWAKSKKLRPQQVSEVLNGKRPFTDPILKALKAKRLTTYEVSENAL